jgi:ankyrin repeat protein
MSDAVPLPPRPDLDEYEKLALDLQHACEADDAAAIRAWATRWIGQLGQLRADAIPPGAIEQEIDRLCRRWNEAQKPQADAERCRLSHAQFFIAREHGFESWPAFASHLRSLAESGSSVSAFEEAADAIVHGDTSRLSVLLAQHPRLVHERSTREHRSTLLHYVSANGVEDFRQKTPPNIVAIAEMLIDAGADVDAASEAYGGGSTTLGLVATSVHPEAAGVQIALLEALLARGAKIEQPGLAGNGHSIVLGCLANGQGAAARFFADRGATLNLEEAAGVGRVDVVKTFFDSEGHLLPGATQKQMESGFLYACGYGAAEAAAFLLARGVDPGTRTDRGQTGLHWAMYGPRVAVVDLLLQHGAPVNARDAMEATPLHWALRGWTSTTDRSEREAYYAIVRRLVDAGAETDLPRAPRHERQGKALDQVRADARMRELLQLDRQAG